MHPTQSEGRESNLPSIEFMNHTTRETAQSFRALSRESRALASTLASEPNLYDRILFAGTQSNRYQVYRRTTTGRMVPLGSYDSLEEAITARDTLPADLEPQEFISKWK
jgi:hypothetical protein